jgi:hypothetical protein
VKHPGLVVFLSALVFYALTAGRPLSEGDSAQYATLARAGDLLEVPSHLGYLLLARLVVHVLGLFEPEMAIRFISLVFGAVGAAAAYQIVWRLTHDRGAGWLAALVLMAAGEYWVLSTVVEVFAVQSGCLLAAYALWLSSAPSEADAAASGGTILSLVRIAGAVVLTGFAGLVSPASVAFLPMFFFGRPITKYMWLAFAAACLGLAGVLVLEPQLITFVLKSRTLEPTVWGAIRDLAFMGVSLGLVTGIAIVLAAIDGLYFATDRLKTKRIRIVLAGIGLTVLCHIPVASIIGTGPFIPTYGLVAVAFGLTIGWLRARSQISYRSLLRVGAGLAVAAGLVIVVALGGGMIHANFNPFSQEWLQSVNIGLVVCAFGLSIVSIVSTLLTLLRKAGRIRGFRFQDAFTLSSIFLAHFLVSLSLIVLPRQQIQRDELAVFRILEAIDPPEQKLVGTYSGLMLYDYERQGAAAESDNYMYADKITPEEFYAALESQGQLFLVGHHVRRTLEAIGVEVPPSHITQLYKDDYLWEVTPGE